MFAEHSELVSIIRTALFIFNLWLHSSFSILLMHCRFYMVFERMRGGTLLDALRARGGRLSEPEAASVASQLAEALAFLHALGVAHRDLKPDNVLLAQPDQVFSSLSNMCFAF